MMKQAVEDGEYLELTLTAEQRDLVLDLFYARTSNGAKMMFISTIAPTDQGLWTLRIVGINHGLGQKLLRVLNREVREKTLISRLKREAPQIAERLGAGQFKSVRAAAIEAGFVRVKTPLDDLRAAWKKARDEEKFTFLSEISSDELIVLGRNENGLICL